MPLNIRKLKRRVGGIIKKTKRIKTFIKTIFSTLLDKGKRKLILSNSTTVANYEPTLLNNKIFNMSAKKWEF